MDLMNENKFDLIINTPTKGRQPLRDGFKIRRKAVEHSIPCFTSLDTARAVAKTLEDKKRKKELSLIDITTLRK